MDINFDIINEALELLAKSYDEPILVKLNKFVDYYHLEGKILTISTAKFKPFRLLFENNDKVYESVNNLLLNYEIYGLDQSTSSNVTPDFSHLPRYKDLELIFTSEKEYDNLAHLQKELDDCGFEKIGSCLLMEHPSDKNCKTGRMNAFSKYYPSFDPTKSHSTKKVCDYELL